MAESGPVCAPVAGVVDASVGAGAGVDVKDVSLRADRAFMEIGDKGVATEKLLEIEQQKHSLVVSMADAAHVKQSLKAIEAAQHSVAHHVDALDLLVKADAELPRRVLGSVAAVEADRAKWLWNKIPAARPFITLSQVAAPGELPTWVFTGTASLKELVEASLPTWLVATPPTVIVTDVRDDLDVSLVHDVQLYHEHGEFASFGALRLFLRWAYAEIRKCASATVTPTSAAAPVLVGVVPKNAPADFDALFDSLSPRARLNHVHVLLARCKLADKLTTAVAPESVVTELNMIAGTYMGRRTICESPSLEDDFVNFKDSILLPAYSAPKRTKSASDKSGATSEAAAAAPPAAATDALHDAVAQAIAVGKIGAASVLVNHAHKTDPLNFPKWSEQLMATATGSTHKDRMVKISCPAFKELIPEAWLTELAKQAADRKVIAASRKRARTASDGNVTSSDEVPATPVVAAEGAPVDEE